MSPGQSYLDQCRGLIDTVEGQLPAIRRAADWFAATILAGRMVHVFASGHSRIMVEEMWPRYGSFPGFNPIVELSLTFHNLVVGANGQRQAMFLENVPGLAERILRNFDTSPADSALVISSSGCNVVPIEMAEGFRHRGIRVVAIISRRHSEASGSRDPRGKKLQDFADLVLDTGAPPGDAMVKIEGLDTPVSPGSTVGGCLLVNADQGRGGRAADAGRPPAEGAERRRGGRAGAGGRAVRVGLRRARPAAGEAVREPGRAVAAGAGGEERQIDRDMNSGVKRLIVPPGH